MAFAAALHRLRILRGDAEVTNILSCVREGSHSRGLGQAVVCRRPPLGWISLGTIVATISWMRCHSFVRVAAG